jgi:hypothetical protein
MFPVSETTQKILKNMGTFGDSHVLVPGVTQRAILQSKSVFLVAHLPEPWPTRPGPSAETAIWKINTFVQMLSTFDKPVIDFKQDAMVVQQEQDKRLKIKYRYSDPSGIETAPTKDLPTGNPAIQFTMSAYVLNTLKKTANMLNLSHFNLVVDPSADNRVTFQANDPKVPNSHEFEIGILPVDARVNDDTYARTIIFNKDHFGYLLDGDYDVLLSGWKYAFFANKDVPVTYFIADQTGQF